MPVIFSRIAREGKTVEVMISLYCRHLHYSRKLCTECAQLINYAMKRLKDCPYQEGKTTCAKRPVHCYQPLMREKIRAVVRYAGPRMTLRHLVLTLFHFIDKIRAKPVESVDMATESKPI